MTRHSDPEEVKKRKQAQKDMQKHYNHFKNKFKVFSKSELTAMLWEQGLQFKELQEIAKELYEENKKLKPVQEDSND